MQNASIGKGVLAALALLAFYFAAVTLISGFDFARTQFLANWYWILGLAVGFGVQIGLLTYLRALHHSRMGGGTVAATGTTSGIAMISCCTHYLANFVPVLGASGFAAIVGQYQTEIFAVGLLINVAGVGYLVKQLLTLKHA